MKNKALFLDRDGVINVEKNYLFRIEDFEFCKGIFQIVKFFESRGYLIFVVTNQSGIGRGYYSLKSFHKLTNWMVKKFQQKNIKITRVYYCPHSPDFECSCRKPKNQMLEDAIDFYEIDRKKSWLIGDKISDILAGKRSNIGNLILINEKNNYNEKINFLAKDSFEIAKFLETNKTFRF